MSTEMSFQIFLMFFCKLILFNNIFDIYLYMAKEFSFIFNLTINKYINLYKNN